MYRNVNLGRMRGRPVIDANGDNVGVVEDVAVDPTTWKVSGFIVTLKREVAQRFHLQAGFLEQPRVEVGSERIRTVGDNVILNIDMEVIGESLRRREASGDFQEPIPPPTTPGASTFDAPVAPSPPPGSPFEPPRY